ncbi:MAG: hypothetical protein HYY24_14525 [Verrucomicrobia bacterium]|nr:hypothetical protein [Verrucomicrobiota bacterium]
MADLTEYLEGKRPGEFSPRPVYVPEGDSLFFYFKEDESYAERVDELLTVYRSQATGKMVGCQIKNVRSLLKQMGDFGVQIVDGPIDLRVIFTAYAMNKMPPPPALSELWQAAQLSPARFSVKELAAA